MKGNKKVVAALNELLADELAARDQYFIHSRMLGEWGLHHAAARIAHEVEDETAHAAALISRILFLEGTPDMVPSKISVGKDIADMFGKDLAVELQVVDNLRKAMALCEHEHDYVTRDLLLKMLIDTEIDHAHWLEQQLRLIDMVGLPNYLQSQLKDGGATG